MKYYIGIDPGQKGGLALIKEGLAVEYVPMPKTVSGILEWIKMATNTAKSTNDQIAMVIERAQPMPGEGVVSVFTYGRHFGTFEALATVFCIPYHEITSSTWKRNLGIPPKSPKSVSIKLCEQLFPTVNLLLPRHSKKHDGMAESILIAEYARRKIL